MRWKRMKTKFEPAIDDSSPELEKVMRSFLPLSSNMMEFLRSASPLPLFCVLFTIYLLLVPLYAFFYKTGGYLQQGSEGAKSFWSCLYFSVACQTTMGFGDITPIGFGRLLACTQWVIATLFFAIMVGVVVAKMVLHTDPIEMSKRIIFYPSDGAFRVRARVLCSRPMPWWETTYSVRELLRVGMARASSYAAIDRNVLRYNFEANNTRPGNSYLLPTLPISSVIDGVGTPPHYVETLCCLPKESLEKTGIELSKEVIDNVPRLIESVPFKSKLLTPVLLTPKNIEDFSHITVSIKYKMQGVGAEGIQVCTYKVPEDIDCGVFDRIKKRRSDNTALVELVDYDNFDEITRTNPSDCKDCVYNPSCYILSYRAQNNEEYQKIKASSM